MMKKFIIGYIEDNHLGVYPKEIIYKASSFKTCAIETIKEFPTVYSIQEVFGELEDKWVKYYTHEAQDQLQESRHRMKIDLGVEEEVES
ncbi:hypothetical protein [Guptibacillus spartinae]|uniref:hypothetical protein n=1 Tax=Guptibacillus spartinae TaxID=3025679 RepID=UPI00235E9DD3|nr:hypothetical protein [Pseudalkalibacillus spartinae]